MDEVACALSLPLGVASFVSLLTKLEYDKCYCWHLVV